MARADLEKLARRAVAGLMRPSNILGLVAVAVVVLSGVYADMQNRTVFQQAQRADVSASLAIIRAKLEGDVTADLQLVRGLVSVIAAEPDMHQMRFAALARNLFDEHTQLRSIAAAPDLVVTMHYPLGADAQALGLDYTRNAVQRAAALRARDTGQLVLAGPVAVLEGGPGFVGRFPVFARDPSGIRRFWGLVSAVIDARALYADSGLLRPDLPIDVALVGRDAKGSGGGQFFGNPAIMSQNPVFASVGLPSGSWQIAAIPKDGWTVEPPNEWLIRGGILFAGALVLMPLAMARRFMDERQRHIQEMLSRERQLDVLSRRLRLALDTSRIGVWEYDFIHDVLVWDARMNELYGLPAEDARRTYADWSSALHPDDFARATREFEEALTGSGRYNSQYRLLLPDGRMRHIRAIGAVYRGSTGDKILGVNWDVSADVALNEDLKRAKALTEARNAELEAAKASIEHNALHDALTGLPNRRYLDRVLEERAARCRQRGGHGLALLHIDLDRFKQINDTLGHPAGDAMLEHAARMLRATVRDTDFVARIGGDEFVVVGANKSARALSRLAERITDEMQQPVIFQKHECRCGVSIGIAHQRGRDIDPRRLLMDADIALYRAKRRGRNCFEFFTPALQAEVTSAKRMADEILAAIDNNEFIAHFQPQFDPSTLAIIGVEALARWHHPTRGIVSPDVFLPIAEDLNVVANIDRMILEQALEAFNEWRRAGLDIPHVSVNVSARRLREDGLIDSLRRLDIAPGTLSFELVESIYLDERDEMVSWQIDQIRELGIGIEIDDFGTGYASIISVLQLQPTRLKIDRQLVMPIADSHERRGLIRSIIEIGHSLGIEVVAEGVETHQHTRLLTELGVDALQGYAFAPPLSADNFLEFATRRAWCAA